MLHVELAVLLLVRKKDTDRAGPLFFTIALLPAPSVCRSGCYASLQRLALFAAHVVSQATMPAPAQQLPFKRRCVTRLMLLSAPDASIVHRSMSASQPASHARYTSLMLPNARSSCYASCSALTCGLQQIA